MTRKNPFKRGDYVVVDDQSGAVTVLWVNPEHVRFEHDGKRVTVHITKVRRATKSEIVLAKLLGKIV